MNDIKERLEEHAQWLEEASESKVRAHVSPETCKQAAEDIREAVKGIDEQDTAKAAKWIMAEHDRLRTKREKHNKAVARRAVDLLPAPHTEMIEFFEQIEASLAQITGVQPTKIEYIPPGLSEQYRLLAKAFAEGGIPGIPEDNQ